MNGIPMRGALAAKLRFSGLSLLLLGAAIAPLRLAAAECTADALSALNIDKVTVTTAALVAAAPPKQAYCDVKGAVATDGEGAGPNSAAFELLLPENWNGKFMFTGGRGQGGNLVSAANSASSPSRFCRC